jgi:hypothetical protein
MKIHRYKLKLHGKAGSTVGMSGRLSGRGKCSGSKTIPRSLYSELRVSEVQAPVGNSSSGRSYCSPIVSVRLGVSDSTSVEEVGMEDS